MVKLVGVLLACACLFLQGAWAQSDDIETTFKRPTRAETTRLEAVLARPVPQTGGLTVLRMYFHEQQVAARLLSDAARLEAVLRTAIGLLPDAHFREKLGTILITKGNLEEGNALKRQAVLAGNPALAALTTANIACDLIHQRRIDLARATLAEVSRRPPR